MLFWPNVIEIQIINYSNSHIHFRGHDDKIRKEVFITDFYGQPDTSKRSESWSLLSRINQGLDKPWCVIGNFNEITLQDKKVGGRLRLAKK